MPVQKIGAGKGGPERGLFGRGQRGMFAEDLKGRREKAVDILDQIARRNGVTLAALRHANGLPPKVRAAAGDVDLVIPTGSAAQYEGPPARTARAGTPGRPVASGPRPQVKASAARKAGEPRRASTTPAATPRKATAPTPPARPTVVAAQQPQRR
jgi:hypothetical protein